jgi:hypothetical protein
MAPSTDRRNIMKMYLLAVHSVEGAPARSDEETQRAYSRVDRVNSELQAAGAWVEE